MTIHRRACKGAIFAAIVSTAIGCGNNTEPADNAATATSPVGATATSTAAPAAFKGIIMASCSGQGAQILTSFDPATGTGTQRTFSLGSGSTTVRICSAYSAPTGRILRQEFNRDFTRLAVATGGMPDGGTHVGYVTNDSDGTFTDLTPKPTGYADPPKENAPMFNPATGRIWFEGPKTLGSVDPDVGPSSSRPESQSSFQNGVMTGAQDIFFFTPDGSKVLDLGSSAYDIYSPDGRTEVDYSANYRIGDPGKVDNSTPLADFPPGGKLCWPKWFMTASTFLCLESSQTQIYKMTISPDRTKLTQTALLPETSQPIGEAVSNADGSQVAFTSNASGTAALYTVTSAGGSEPKKVADLPDTTGSLIDWTQ